MGQDAHGAKWAADQFWEVMCLAGWCAVDTSAFHHAFALKYYVWQGGVGAAAPAASFQENIELVPESRVRNPLQRGFMDTSMQKGFEMPSLWKSKLSLDLGFHN